MSSEDATTAVRDAPQAPKEGPYTALLESIAARHRDPLWRSGWEGYDRAQAIAALHRAVRQTRQDEGKAL